ncbi:MAG: hypothetical protein SFU56_05290 [Capsulimonadales bacterium]|nr:hypothetical protein [Capsulimonadales bacterium]
METRSEEEIEKGENMAALTGAYEAKRTVGQQKAYRMAASTTIHKGALVAVNSQGWAVPASDTAGLIVVGVAAESRTNGTPAGATAILVDKSGEYEYAFAGTASQTIVGKLALVTDDNTVNLATTNSIAAGYVTEVPATNRVRIRIDNVTK